MLRSLALLLIGALALPVAPGVPAQPTADSTDRFSAGSVDVPERVQTEVLVLGSPHLAEVGPRFRPVMVNRLIDVLEQYDPRAIAVESLPPAAIRAMQNDPAYDSVLTRFAGPQLRYGRLTRRRSGLDVETARVRSDSLLARINRGGQTGNDGAANPDRRLRLVESLVSAYRLDSAALQWSFLPDSVRRAQRVVPDTVAAYFRYRRIRAHEIDAVAIRLARRLGLQQLTPIDDHREKDALTGIEGELRRTLPVDSLLALQEFVAQIRDRRSRAVARSDLFPFYRYVNSDGFLESALRRQWLFYYRTGLDSGLDRSRAALWDTRNLLMTAHVRRLTARHPGERILVLVGASHKPFLDAFLDAAVGVRRVDLSDLLDRYGRPPELPAASPHGSGRR